MDETKGIANLLKFDMTKFTPKSDAAVAEFERRFFEKSRDERYRKQAPERYWRESLDTYRTDTEERRDAAEQAREFSRAAKCGSFRTLILLGGAGTGKTHLACGILRETGGLYRLSSAIAEEIRRARSFGAKETEADVLDRYGRASLLVIDEIGRGISAEEERYMLYQIINELYNRRKPTVLISNQPKKDFLNYVGIAAADRLTESATVAEFSGKSYRAEIRREGRESALDSAGV